MSATQVTTGSPVTIEWGQRAFQRALLRAREERSAFEHRQAAAPRGQAAAAGWHPLWRCRRLVRPACAFALYLGVSAAGGASVGLLCSQMGGGAPPEVSVSLGGVALMGSRLALLQPSAGPLGPLRDFDSTLGFPGEGPQSAETMLQGEVPPTDHSHPFNDNRNIGRQPEQQLSGASDVAERHAQPSQIPGMRCSTSALQGHGVDEPEALAEALRRSQGLAPSVLAIAAPTAAVPRADPAVPPASTDTVGQSEPAPPARPGPYSRAAACLDDVPQSIIVRNTFIDVGEVSAREVARSLRRVRTDEQPSSTGAYAFSGAASPAVGVLAAAMGNAAPASDVPPPPAPFAAAERQRPLEGCNPPAQLRRLNEQGDAAPGAQDSELASRAAQQLHLDEQGARRPQDMAGVDGPVTEDVGMIDASQADLLAATQPAFRFYCPVAGCPRAVCARSAGWGSLQAMRSHLEEHAGGRFVGAIPEVFMEEHSLRQCTICSRLLKKRFGPACPRCKPKLAPARQDAAGGRDIPGDWPSWDEVFEANIPTKAHVPQGARKLWAQCLVGALAQTVQHGDLRAWMELLMLPKAVLRSSNRGGRNNKKKLDGETKERCRAWIEGKRRELWEPLGQRGSRPAVEYTAEQRERRAFELAKQGLLQKASAALANSPPVQVTDAVVAEMQDKHPAARRGEAEKVANLRPIQCSAATQVGVEDVEKTIRAFPRGSAAGPSGLKPQHLRDALVPGWQDEVLRQIASLCNKLARGEAPTSVRGWLCGASLAALPKPNGSGLRPVAVGETWRRVVGKALATEAADDLRSHLEPLQLGVGSKAGCEAIVHTVRQWLGRNKTDTRKVLASLDLSNAFNCVDRSAFLQETRRVCPRLAPWVDFCYQNASHLLLGAGCLSSARGVQQGDPLGPAMFSLAIQERIRRARERTEALHPGELDFVVFFLDDGILGGTVQAVRSFCELLRAEMAEAGLDLSFSKCEVVPAAGAATEVSDGDVRGFAWRPDGNIKLLGAPFGSAEFCRSHTLKRKEKAATLLQVVGDLQDSQSALQLVRNCTSFCKLVYSTRTVPPHLHSQALDAFSRDVRGAIETITGDLVDDRSWAQAQLPVRHGGIGLRCASRHAAAAYLASVSQSRELCARIDLQFSFSDEADDLCLQTTRAALLATVDASSLPDLVEGKLTQRTLSGLVDDQLKATLVGSTQADGVFRAHLSLVGLPTAGVWLQAPPVVEDGRAIEPSLFRVALRRRLRIPVQTGDSFCPLCGDTMDSFGDHALACQCNGDRTVRHNCLRNIGCEDARVAGLQAERERPGLLPSRPAEDGIRASPGDRRPADVWLPRGPQNRPTALDFAVTSGLRSDLWRQVAETPNHVFEFYEHYKRSYKDTERLCEDQGFAFLPMVMEAHSGAWSPSARRAWGFVARNMSAAWNEGQEPSSLKLAQRLCCSLQRENARAVLRRLAEADPGQVVGTWEPMAELGLMQ